MRKMHVLAFAIPAILVFAGCGGGSHVTSIDKTLIHKTGTLNLSQVKSTSSKLEVRTAGGQWQDMTAAKSKDIETWFKGKNSAEAQSFLIFDDFQMPLESKQVTKASQLIDMQEELHKRSKDIQDFMQNKDRQLDARKW